MNNQKLVGGWRATSLFFGLVSGVLCLVSLVCVGVQDAHADRNSGLVGWWKMDDNTGTVATDSGGSFSGFSANNGDLTNGPTWVTGHNGYAVNFDGNNDFIRIADSSTLDMGTSDYSISMWIKTTSVAGVQQLMSKFASNGAGAGYYLRLNTSLIEGFLTDGTDQAGPGFGTVVANAWTHVVITVDRDVAHGVIGYQNGVAQACGNNCTYTLTDVDNIDNAINGGISTRSGDDPGLYFSGVIDDVRVYKRVLSAAEVKDLYNAGSLIAWWKLDDNSGTAATDSACYGGTSSTDNECNVHTATLVGGPTWGVGKRKYAVNFDGTNYAWTASTIVFGVKVITVCFWLKWTAYANDDDLAMELSENANANDGAFFVDPNCSFCSGRFGVAIQDGTGSVVYRAESFTRPSAGVWHHYCFVLDNSTTTGDITSYVDGVVQTENLDLNGKDQSSNFVTHNLYFMSRAGTSLISAGSMDDVRIYDRALTATEVRRLYAGDHDAVRPVQE